MEQELGILKQRIQGVESGYTDLRNAFQTLNTKLDERFTALSTKLDERSKTPWSNIISACGVTMGVIIAIGTLAMSPIRDNISEINSDYKYLIREQLVPRGEHLQLWKSNASEFEFVRARIAADSAEKQRQIDELRNQYNAVYGARDVILDLKDRLHRLELETGKKG